MKFTVGFFDRAVLQRAANNKSEQVFEGECSVSGNVYASVLKGAKACKGLTEVKVGRASGGKFKGILKGIPVGGPYDIVFNIADKSGKTLETAKVKSVMVGDLWLLGGQSNMEGYGLLATKLKPMKEVRAYYMDNRWATAEDPIHNLWQAHAPIHAKLGCAPTDAKTTNGTGPGVSFGQEMYKFTKVPQGLISCAHGGTSMEQWDPDRLSAGDESLYGASINRVTRVGGKIAGIIWYQGCNDACTSSSVPYYSDRMLSLVKAFRKDLKNPSLPFVMAQLGRVTRKSGEAGDWDIVRGCQYDLMKKTKNLQTVATVDLGLDDQIHISGEGQNKLGKRFAYAMRSISDKKLLKPMEIESAKISKELGGWGTSIIEIVFKNVSGSLQSIGLASGFILNKINIVPSDEEFIYPYKVELKGNIAYVHTALPANELGFYTISYGSGFNTYSNITDGIDRSIPAFVLLPSALGIKYSTAYAHDAFIAGPFYLEEKESNMGYPANADSLNFVKAVSNGMALYHPEREKYATPEDKIFYYKFMIDCPHEMALELMTAYDGPLKLFIDRHEVFTDMNGSNPMGVDKVAIKLNFKSGRHEVFVVLASNKGKAWGIKCRMAFDDLKSIDKQPVFGV